MPGATVERRSQRPAEQVCFAKEREMVLCADSAMEFQG